jgi:ribosome-associated heat shock protein Hsp15
VPTDDASPSSGGLQAVRVDKWLWAVRLYKTRSEATDACRAGHVKLNGSSAKPASLVKPGDALVVRNASGEHVVEVTGVLEKRVGAAIATSCYIDRTPPAAPEERAIVNFARERGTGRPTKRDRRQLDRLRRR